MHSPTEPATSPDARRRLERLDALAAVLAARGDALALIGLGSVGTDLYRLDEHSDIDFFVIVEDGAKQRYLDRIDWLEAAHPVAYSFSNSVDGRKALFADDVFAEYAVFTLAELAGAAYPPGRLVWRRDDAPADLHLPRRRPGPSPYDTVDYQANEVITNLYVGLHRDIRGERLSAARFIQSYAVDRIITMLNLCTGEPGQDMFDLARGVERRFGPEVLPLADFMPGYRRNREAAAAILDWLQARVELDAVMVAAVRALL